jgi:hypothetical protein
MNDEPPDKAEIDAIEGIFEGLLRRVQTITSAGGVSRKDIMDGKKKPCGFIFDELSQYYIPPNLYLDEHTMLQ